jgi:putative transposase
MFYQKIYLLIKQIKYFITKAFYFRLYLTIDQSNQLNQHIASCRFVYNWALDPKVKTDEQIGKSIYRLDLNKLIPNLKKQHSWLGKVNPQALKGMTKRYNLHSLDFLEKRMIS